MLSKLAFKKHKYALSLLENQSGCSFFSTSATEKEADIKNKPENDSTEKASSEVKNEGRNINADPENPSFS